MRKQTIIVVMPYWGKLANNKIISPGKYNEDNLDIMVLERLVSMGFAKLVSDSIEDIELPTKPIEDVIPVVIEKPKGRPRKGTH